MTMNFETHKQFAPLQTSRGQQSKQLPRLKGIIFDFDGTLCLPQSYMFKQMRLALGIDKKVDILDYCYSLPPDKQKEALGKIREVERKAMTAQVPQPGLVTLMEYLENKDIPKAICTRNFDAPVSHLLEKFLPNVAFSPVVTRNFRPPKPDPAGILHIAKSWGFLIRNDSGNEIPDASDIIMVGDSLDDLTAGYRAGAATVLLVSETNQHLKSHEYCDLAINCLNELIGVLEEGFVARSRKEGEHVGNSL